ncbi:hypothetical protein OS493_030230 [Desmophyllum pertusum]|uniref:Uncharacterized protein n=1 Tax=Desmophyllum pertusum TaxID=174260 RepID=A0A9W9YA80_9CNID|nr:hypothetical protein OS493_030230 [Desmophyllum pertusum]
MVYLVENIQDGLEPALKLPLPVQIRATNVYISRTPDATDMINRLFRSLSVSLDDR